MDKFTKGPWFVMEWQDDDFRINISDGSDFVACVYCEDTVKESEEEKATAHLIAQSPRMYGYIKGCANRGDDTARAIIADIEEGR